jgi:O-antigen/teichoic acid export membrane protein
VSKRPTPKAQNAEKAVEHGSYRAGFSFGSLSFLTTAIIGLGSTILTSRLYGVHVIGQFALASAPTLALFTLSSIKEQQALIREITRLRPRHPRVTQLFAAVFTFSWALTSAVAILDAAVCLFVFPGPLHAPELLWPALASLAGYTVFANTGWNIDSVLSAFVAGRQLFLARLCEALAFVAIAVAIGIAWISVWGLVIATVGASVAGLILRLFLVRAYIHSRLSWKEFRGGLAVLPGLLRFGLKATPGQIAQGISQQGGVWALGIVSSTAVVGAYSRALSLPQRLQHTSLRITDVLYPTLVGRHSDGDGHGFDRALIDSIRYQVIGMLLVAAALGGAAHSVLNIFGPGFAQAAPALVLLAIFPAMASVNATQTQALWAVDRPGFTSLIALARLVTTIGLLVVLTPRLGIVGPAVALLAGYLVIIAPAAVVLRRYLRRPMRASWPLRERFALIAAYGAGFAAAHGAERLIPSNAGVIVCLACGTLAYGACFVLAGGLNERDRSRLGEVLARRTVRIGGRAAMPVAFAAGSRPDAGIREGSGIADSSKIREL